MLKRFLLAFLVLLTASAAMVAVCGDSSAEDTWDMEVDGFGCDVGETLTYKVNLYKNGEQLADDDPFYNEVQYRWSITHYGTPNPIQHPDGTYETERSVSIPGAIMDMNGMFISCSVTYDEYTINESVRIDVYEPDSQIVVVGDEVIKGDGTLNIGGGTITVSGDMITFRNVKLDVKDFRWGMSKNTLISIENMDDVNLVFLGNNVLNAEIPHIYFATETGYKNGVAISVNLCTHQTDSFTMTGPGSLEMIAGQFGLIIEDITRNCVSEISNMRVTGKITCTEFSFLNTAFIYSDGTLKITDCNMSFTTDNRQGLEVGSSAEDYTQGNLIITGSKVSIVNNDHITDGEGYVNCIIANAIATITDSEVTLENVSTIGVKPASIFAVKVSGTDDVCQHNIINSKLTILDSSKEDHRIFTIGSHKADIVIDNSDVTLIGKEYDDGIVICRSLQIVNGSSMYVENDTTGLTACTSAQGIYCRGETYLQGSSLEILTINPAKKTMDIGILTNTLVMEDDAYIHSKTSSTGGAAIAGQLTSKKEFDPEYVPEHLFIGTLPEKWLISPATLQLEGETLYAEVIYDISGDAPIMVTEVELGKKPQGENTVVSITAAAVAAVVVIAALGVLIFRRP